MAPAENLSVILHEEMLHPTLRRLCAELLTDRSFCTCPGSLKHHHKEAGGLLKHTEEVVLNCIALSTRYEVDKEILLTAAMFHDVAKTKEYIERGDVEYRAKIGHVVGSFIEWAASIEATGLYKSESGIPMEVGHCILAHHGRYEWGSPKLPQTIEAIVLHAADMKSAQNADQIAIVEKWISLSKK